MNAVLGSLAAVLTVLVVVAVGAPRLAHPVARPLAASAPAVTASAAPLSALPARPVAAPASASPGEPASVGAVAEAPEALATILAGDDEMAKIEAIHAAVGAGQVAELDVLARADLARAPRAAATIIHGLARLGVQGSPREAAQATTTLARWLREERARDASDAFANVPNLVEALGALGGGEAVTAFVDLLERGAETDLALETLTVQQLAALGDPRGKAAIQHFLERTRARPASDDAFERELVAEALTSASEALERL